MTTAELRERLVDRVIDTVGCITPLRRGDVEKIERVITDVLLEAQRAAIEDNDLASGDQEP